ncbi:GTP-binding protein 2 [Schistosoma japonicum]|nr:GTP-binding protein 2 [Schistosoma japonicum]
MAKAISSTTSSKKVNRSSKQREDADKKLIEANEARLKELEEEKERLRVEKEQQVLRAQQEKEWNRYFQCNNLPNPCITKEINTFISLWNDNEDQITMNDVIRDSMQSFHIIDELNYLISELSSNEEDKEIFLNYQQTKNQLIEQIYQKFNRSIIETLTTALHYADHETMNLQKIWYNPWIVMCIWGNLSKNPRIRQFTFSIVDITFDIPKVLSLSDCAILINFMKYDNYSWKCQSYYPCKQSESNPVNWIKANMEKDAIDLGNYHVIGGVFRFELVTLPRQPKTRRGWTMTTCVIPPILHPFEYIVDTPEDIKTENESVTDEVSRKQEKKEEKPPIQVKIRIPKCVIIVEDPILARWDAEKLQWRTTGIQLVKFNEDDNTVTFHTSVFGIMAIFQDYHVNMPFQYWELRPLPLRRNALVNTTTESIHSDNGDNKNDLATTMIKSSTPVMKSNEVINENVLDHEVINTSTSESMIIEHNQNVIKNQSNECIILGPSSTIGLSNEAYQSILSSSSSSSTVINQCLLTIIGGCIELRLHILGDHISILPNDSKSTLTSTNDVNDDHHNTIINEDVNETNRNSTDSWKHAKRELNHLWGKWFTLDELITVLQQSGVNVFPREDSISRIECLNKNRLVEENLYEHMALLSPSMAFGWSRWNDLCQNDQTVIVKAVEHLDTEDSIDEVTWKVYSVSRKKVLQLEMKEYDEQFNPMPNPNQPFHADFYHMYMEIGCDEGKHRVEHIDLKYFKTVKKPTSFNNGSQQRKSFRGYNKKNKTINADSNNAHSPFLNLNSVSDNHMLSRGSISTKMPHILPPEVEEGNIEYKRKLVDPTPNRFEQLVTQMKWRLNEGGGKAIYKLGVDDDGHISGLRPSELISSLTTLERMARRLNATLHPLRERVIEPTTISLDKECRKAVEMLVRLAPTTNEGSPDLCVALVGGMDSGKSTLIGVLTDGELDNARGKARLNLFRHLHEVQSGRTSSLSRELLGFDINGNVTNYKYADGRVYRRSAEEVTGHSKYQRTTLAGIACNQPMMGILVISATIGLSTIGLDHIQLLRSLSLPMIVVLTKIDQLSNGTEQMKRIQLIYRQLVYQFKQIENAWSYGGVSSSLSTWRSNECSFINHWKFNSFNRLSRLNHYSLILDMPIPLTNSSSQEQQLNQQQNIEQQHSLEFIEFSNEKHIQLMLIKINEQMNIIKTYRDFNGTLFWINQVYTQIPGVCNPVIVGRVQLGQLLNNQILWLGPDQFGDFYPVQIVSLMHNRQVHDIVYAGQSASMEVYFLPKTWNTMTQKQRHNILQSNPPVILTPIPSSGQRVSIYAGCICQSGVILEVIQQCKHEEDDEGCVNNQNHLDDTTYVVLRFTRHPELLEIGRKFILTWNGNLKTVGYAVELIDPLNQYSTSLMTALSNNTTDTTHFSNYSSNDMHILNKIDHTYWTNHKNAVSFQEKDDYDWSTLRQSFINRTMTLMNSSSCDIDKYSSQILSSSLPSSCIETHANYALDDEKQLKITLDSSILNLTALSELEVECQNDDGGDNKNKNNSKLSNVNTSLNVTNNLHSLRSVIDDIDVSNPTVSTPPSGSVLGTSSASSNKRRRRRKHKR